MNIKNAFLSSFLPFSSVVFLPAYAAPELKISQHVWLEFSISEKAAEQNTSFLVVSRSVLPYSAKLV